MNKVTLTKLGKKNAIKLQESGQYPDGPKAKDCAECGEPMDWRTTGQLTRAKKGGPIYYHKNHNGKCQKDNISIPVKILVESGEMCNNPGCSKVPTLSWLKNKKAYCSVECIEAYRSRIVEVSLLIIPFTIFTLLLKGRGRLSLLPLGSFLNTIYTLTFGE